MVFKRLLTAAGVLKAPEPTTTPISVEVLGATVDGIVRNVPATMGTGQDFNRAQALSTLYYNIAGDIEALIGEGGAYNRPEGMDDDRFRLIRAIKGIGTALSLQDDPAETVEIDNDILVNFRESLYQLRLLEKPVSDDPLVERIRTDFDEIWQFASMPTEKKIDVHDRAQTFFARAQEFLVPLVQEVKPNAKPQQYGARDEHHDGGGSNDWDLL